MDFREEMVKLITGGTPGRLIIFFFVEQGLEPIEVDEFLHACGVSLPHRVLDHSDISDERRRELQALSISE